MNVFELLKNDHSRVSALFTEIENTADTAERENLFQQIKQNLTVHAEAEEKVFYPRLEREAETEEIIEEAFDEHQEIKELLGEIETMSAEDDEWLAAVMKLKDTVEHHVEEEEGEMFDRAREVLSDEEINRLGDEIRAEEQKRMSATS